jgi:hypothetical protein
MDAVLRSNRLVRRIHFEDYGGAEFERLVFAYHVRAGWQGLEWYGQTGSDQGRDILGSEIIEDGHPRKTVIQCVNRGNLARAKALNDMRRAMLAPGGPPEAFKFVTRAGVSASLRDAVREAANRLGIANVTIWSGPDFEEHLRLIGEDLLRRFCGGEAFPDRADEIKTFADDFPGLCDGEALALMAAVFDRPAFTTPFHLESSLPAFLTAIEDTISALNTGIWRDREGAEIRRIPSVHHLKSPSTMAAVANTIRKVDGLRRLFVGYLRSGDVRPCGCGQPDCPVFMLSERAARDLDQARRDILNTFRAVHSPLAVRLE